jgi:hypothetical protein
MARVYASPDSFVEIGESNLGHQRDGRNACANHRSSGDHESDDEGIDRSGNPPADGFRQRSPTSLAAPQPCRLKLP